MAYFPKKNSQTELATMNSLGPTNQTQNTIQAGQQSGMQAPVGGSSSSSSASSGANAPKSTKSSGMGADIRKYVNQNQPQSIASGVEKSTESQAQAVGQQVQKQQSQFMNQVNQQRSMAENAYNQAQNTINQAQNLGANATLDDNAIKQYQAASQMKATAPQLDLTAAQGQAQRLANTAQQAASGNKSELLRQAFTGQGQAYTGGQSALDELILGGDKTAGERLISQAQQVAQSQQANLADARRQAAQQSGGLEQQAADYRNQLGTGVTSAQDTLRADLEARLGQTPQLRQAFESGQITQDVIDQLGVDRLYGVDPLAYLREANISSVSSAEDLARAKALAQLGGTQQDIITDETQVGSEDVTGMQALQNMINERKADYESDYNPLSEKISNIQKFYDTNKGNAYDDVVKQFTTSSGASDMGDQVDTQAVREYYEKAAKELGLSDLTGMGVNRNVNDEMVRLLAAIENNSTSNLSRVLSPYQQQASSLQSKYDYNNLLTPTPVTAANGAIKESTASLLKRLLENK